MPIIEPGDKLSPLWFRREQSVILGEYSNSCECGNRHLCFHESTICNFIQSAKCSDVTVSFLFSFTLSLSIFRRPLLSVPTVAHLLLGHIHDIIEITIIVVGRQPPVQMRRECSCWQTMVTLIKSASWRLWVVFFLLIFAKMRERKQIIISMVCRRIATL